MTDADRVSSVALTAGSFWAETYGDAATVGHVARAVLYLLDEMAVRLDDAAACRIVDRVPTLLRPRWYPLKFAADGAAVRSYGDGLTYQTAGVEYGRSDPRPGFAGPLPLADCPLVFETAVGGGRCWVAGRDFTVASYGWILFDKHPGPNELWAFEPGIDLDYMWKAFGFLTGVKEVSSDGYCEFVRAFLAQAAGDTAAGLRRLVCAAFDTPSAPADTYIEQVTELAGGRVVVVTGDGCYPTDLAVLNPGDFVAAGDSVTGAVQFDTYRGPVDAAPTQLSLDAGMVLTGSLTFGPGLSRAGPNASEFATNTADRESRYGRTVNAAMGGAYAAETDVLLRECLRYGVTLVTAVDPPAVSVARLSALRPVLPVHAVLVFHLAARELADAEPLTVEETLTAGIAMTPLVDSTALVEYDHSMLTPLSC